MREYIIRETGYPGTLTTETVGELVRCRDCREYQQDTIFDRNGCRRFPTLPITKDFFCPYGERKGNAE